MGSLAQDLTVDRPARAHAFGLAVLRSERSMALIRIAITAAVMAIYLSSLGIQRAFGPSAILVLTLAAVYSVGTLLWLSVDRAPSITVRVTTLLIDVLLVTLWVQSTGGRQSEFWTLYLIVMVSAALRFRLIETLGVAMGVITLHVVVTMGGGGLERSQLIYRPTLMLVTGFAVAVLAYQRAEHRRERNSLQALAELRALELGQERDEVERLRRVDIKRSEFVAIAAHEFRTPLAAIVGVLSTLKAHWAVLEDEVREELIDGASAQSERLSRLVEDLLTASRLEDGVLRLHLEPVDVRDLIRDAESASGTAGRVHVELHRVDPIVCDADAVVRVLANLLDNSRKYAPEGSRITISASQDEGFVRLSVRDAGPGIPEDEREAVFERFRRIGDRRAPGAGLGLYISRGLVEAHGGEMAIGEAPEGGAEFSFRLPRLPVPDDVVVNPVTASPVSVD